jgi:hypothetical protein
MVDGRRPGAHPDENLLAAFAERALTPNERESVLEHLSACVRCRDIVFLTQQAFSDTIVDEARVVTVTPAPGRRRLWWGPVAAGGVLAVLLIAGPILMYRERASLRSASLRSMKQVASEIQPASPAAISQAEGQPGKITPSTSVQVTKQFESNAADSASRAKPGAGLMHPMVAGASSADAAKAHAEDPAEIGGSVADRTGAAIPGAQVTVRAKFSGNARTAVTDTAGEFNVAALPSGDYQVEVRAPGFSMFSQPVTVQPSERASLDAKLDVGAASQTVTVTAASGGVAGGILGGLAPAPGATPRTELKNRDAARPPVNGRNSQPVAAAAPAATLPPTPAPQVTVPAAQPPVSTGGPFATGMVVNGALPGATFLVKDGVVQRCLGAECVARSLPSKAKAVSAVASARTVIALDSDGNLFLSSDQGEHWEQAKVQWPGKAVALRSVARHSQEMFMLKPSDPPAASANRGAIADQKSPVLAVTAAIIELTNDKGQAWISSDEGKTWVAK